MAFLAMGVFWGAWHAMIPRVKLDVGASDAALGSALLCVAIGAVPAMVLGGRMVGRLGPWLLPASIGLFGIAAVLPTLADDPIELSLALFLVGAASGFMDVMGNTRISELESREKSRFMHLAHGLFSAAYLVAALSTGLARGIGIGTMAILGAVSAVMLAQAACAVTRPLSSHRHADPEAPAGRTLGLPVMLFGAIVFVAFLSENGLQSWTALHLERSLAATPAIGALGAGGNRPCRFPGAVRRTFPYRMDRRTRHDHCIGADRGRGGRGFCGEPSDRAGSDGAVRCRRRHFNHSAVGSGYGGSKRRAGQPRQRYRHCQRDRLYRIFRGTGDPRLRSGGLRHRHCALHGGADPGGCDAAVLGCKASEVKRRSGAAAANIGGWSRSALHPAAKMPGPNGSGFRARRRTRPCDRCCDRAGVTAGKLLPCRQISDSLPLVSDRPVVDATI